MLSDAYGCLRIVLGDVPDNLLEIFDRRVRPDYAESHFLRLSLTCSWGTTRPALMSASPISIPARNRMRSSMSAHVAESGKS